MTCSFWQLEVLGQSEKISPEKLEPTDLRKKE